MIGIYKITSPTNRIYIGQSINIEYRKKWYSRMYAKEQPKLFNSINKYTWDNHIFEIIEECSLVNLNSREIFWKKFYLDNVGGDWSQVLFCELYDNGGGPKSESTKEKMSKTRMGWTDSEETKQKKSNSFKGRKGSDIQKLAVSKWWIDNPTRSLEFCSSLGKSKTLKSDKKCNAQNRKIDKPNHSNNRPIIQYDIYSNIISNYPSIAIASRTTGVRSDSISACCRGVQKTSGGFIWRYKE
jgi:group I intron endonuclease